MDLAEIYKLAGATLGFVATGMTLWDRTFRHRPSVSITSSDERSVRLRVKNQAPFDVVLTKICSGSELFRVQSANSISASIHYAMGTVLPVLLAPGEERLLRIAEMSLDSEELDREPRFKIAVEWTRGDHPYFHPPSVRLWTSGADIRRRKQAAEASDES